MLRYAREEVQSGPVAAPRGGRSALPTVALLGEMFPADPVIIGQMLAPMGLAVGPTVPTREWRELYAALDCAAVAAGLGRRGCGERKRGSGRAHHQGLRHIQLPLTDFGSSEVRGVESKAKW